MKKIKTIINALRKETEISIDSLFISIDFKINPMLFITVIMQFIILFVAILVAAVLLAIYY